LTRSKNTPANLASGRRKTVQSRRTTIVVESNIPTITGVLVWERELLLAIVERLLEDTLAGLEQAAET
jgi:hypothetical protein